MSLFDPNKPLPPLEKKTHLPATKNRVDAFAASARLEEKARSDKARAFRDPIPGHMPEMISVKEAAFRLRVSTDAVYSWLRRGVLYAIQPGGKGSTILVDAESVQLALTRRPALTPTGKRRKKKASPFSAHKTPRVGSNTPPIAKIIPQPP